MKFIFKYILLVVWRYFVLGALANYRILLIFFMKIIIKTVVNSKSAFAFPGPFYKYVKCDI